MSGIRTYCHRKAIITVKYGNRVLSRWLQLCDLKYKKINGIMSYFPQNKEFLVNKFLSQKFHSHKGKYEDNLD